MILVSENTALNLSTVDILSSEYHYMSGAYRPLNLLATWHKCIGLGMWSPLWSSAWSRYTQLYHLSTKQTLYPILSA